MIPNAVTTVKRAKLQAGFLHFLLVCASLLFSLALFELMLRFFWTHPAEYARATDESLFWRYDSLLGWAMEPNRRGLFIRPEFQTAIATNRYGLRDDDFPVEKGEGEIRILLLGDSVVAGFEVARDSTLEAHLERRLNALKDGRFYQVINAGFRGYGTDQEYLFLKDRGLRFRPDVVVLAFVPANDLENNVTIHTAGRKFAKPYFLYDDAGRLTLQGVPVPYPPPQNQLYSPLLQPSSGVAKKAIPADSLPLGSGAGWMHRFKKVLSTNLYSYAFLSQRLKAAPPGVVAVLQKYGILRATTPQEWVDFYRTPVPASWEQRWRISLDLIRAIHRLCRINGVDFALWMFPLKEQVYARDRNIFLRTYGLQPDEMDFDLPEKRLKAFCEEEGIYFIPTLNQFRQEARRGRRLHYRTDNHFNAAGHALMADILMRELLTMVTRRGIK